MARLKLSERAGLPDRAFAYVDAEGRRRLPIHDAAHVRNALARFGQVEFADEAVRDKARTRLLQAAKKYRIVPIGFITNELQTGRPGRSLPSGFVTLVMTDIEGSTKLVDRFRDGYQAILGDVCTILRDAIDGHGGHEVESRADEYFAAFATPRPALDAAVAVQLALAERAWPDGSTVRVRIGIHSGYPTSTADNYIGLDVNTTSRICTVGHGGQIVVSANTREAVKATEPAGVRFTALGEHRLRGLPGPVALFQVGAKGLPTRFPPLRLPTNA